MIFRIANFNDLFPLLMSRINSSWIVTPGLEEDDLGVRHCLEIGDETFDVEALGGWVIVSDLINFKSSSLNNGVVG